MSQRHLASRCVGVLAAIGLMLTVAAAEKAPEEAPEARGADAQARPATAPDSAESAVRVGKLVLGDEGVSGSDRQVCFADGFLTSFARETGIAVHRQLERTTLESDALFDFPFIVLAGQGAFALSDDERGRLEAYIRRGGFVLASAGCSNAPWAGSFRELADDVLGEEALEPLAEDHAIFRILYEIEQVDARVADPRESVLGYEVDGVVRVVFSPVGLNDTDRAGGGCCCCGGHEVRNARLINANILAYALTH